MTFINHVLIILLILIANYAIPQQVNGSDNERINEPLKFPWAGGMNAVQYGEVDLNLDGTNDLVAFDRRGNRLMCFLNSGIANSVDYTYAPEYETLFPKFYHWIILRDYDMDGRSDIFTYSPGFAGIIVYRNISVNTLKFERIVYPYLKTEFPGGEVNLYVTYADYPGIADVDFDGDLDILTFGVLGSFIDMHKNMSMEKYGNADSLDFEHYTYCWGNVAESDESNEIYLDTCFVNKNSSLKKERHIGSTFMVHDIDDNGLVDVLLGDVDYPQLFALYNGGTAEDAYITNFDTFYPWENEVNLFSMPCASYIDVNNDGTKDMLVSPFDPGPTTSRNKKSSWFYLNNGTDNLPDFNLVQKDFLQTNMIDVGTAAYPVVFDWDMDGLSDLFIGNYGYYWYSYYDNSFLKSVYYSSIAYYKNTGSIGNPKFQLWDRYFGNLASHGLLGLVPSFEDLDGDGKTDLLVGKADGKLLFLRNDGNDEFTIITDEYAGIDIGDFSTPQLYDLDKDGDNDLIIGEKAGNINYFINSSPSDIPDFEFITDSLGKVNVTDYSISYDGYSVPCFFKNNGTTELVVGSEQGKIFYFTDVDGNIMGEFMESDKLYQLLDTTELDTDRGMRTSAVITDFIDNSKLEMIVGNYSGGLNYFNGSADVNTSVNNFTAKETLHLYPNPASHKVIIECDFANSYKFEIFNAKGASINPDYRIHNNQFELNVAPLNAGVYILKLSKPGVLKVSRLAVIH